QIWWTIARVEIPCWVLGEQASAGWAAEIVALTVVFMDVAGSGNRDPHAADRIDGFGYGAVRLYRWPRLTYPGAWPVGGHRRDDAGRGALRLTADLRPGLSCCCARWRVKCASAPVLHDLGHDADRDLDSGDGADVQAGRPFHPC